MLKDLFYFEWFYYTRKPAFYITLIIFLTLGILAGSTSGFTFPNVYKNSPYEITYLTGVLSLAAIFSITLNIAQSFLRETETKFSAILFATPVPKFKYLFSRYISILLVSILSFTMAAAGIYFGNTLAELPEDKFGTYHLINYLNPLLVLAVPNILLCVSVLCSTAWLTRNKLVVYIAGLFIYIIYIIGSIFSNSPLIAGASVSTPQEMSLFAKLDPFGLAAFFEQTRYWTAEQRNTLQLTLSGDFLFNRILWGAVSILILVIAYLKHSFHSLPNQKIRKKKNAEHCFETAQYQPVRTEVQTHKHNRAAFFSFIKLDVISVVKGIPFILIIILWTALLIIEISNALSGDVRMGENYARSGLIISTIMETIPFFTLLVVLFYSSELVWKSRSFNFSPLENTTPVHPASLLFSKLISLYLIPVFLIFYSCVAGVIFQLANSFYVIEFGLYLSLFYYLGVPLLFSTILVIAIQTIIKNKYAGLALSALVIFLTSTKLGLMVGINHPLIRYANSLYIFYGDMNGLGSYPTAFHWKMLFNAGIAAVIVVGTSLFANRSASTMGRLQKIVLALAILASLTSGGYIFYETDYNNPTLSKNVLNDWKQQYEEQFKKYENNPQPTITKVTAQVDLYPKDQYYQVKGKFTLVNKTGASMDSLLLYVPEEIELTSINIRGASLLKNDLKFHHQWYKPHETLQDGDSLFMNFSFKSSWSPFKDHTPFNSIIENGSFIRISTYFPRFGYNSGNEITNSIEREKRKLPPEPPLKKVESPIPENYDYAFINLDLTISTEEDQTAISSGDLVKEWRVKNRRFFQYISDKPMPFRFAISSARYKIKRDHYKNIPVEIYYDERHAANVLKLIQDTKQTLQYCENNFSRYPHNVIRFAEVSSFAEGFSATAYPSVIYMKENGGFNNNLSNTESHDVINQLAGHELSHQWWGSSQIAPEYKEGGWLLSETLAGYTALMLYQKTHGKEATREVVRQHMDIYLSNRSFSKETPLYKTTYNTPHLPYNKGLVVMYQLQQLIGETPVNKALSALLENHSFPKEPPTSQDLITEFYKATSPEYHTKIDELFKMVITWDAKIIKADVIESGAGYEISFEVLVKKYEEDSNGKKQERPFTDSVEVAIHTEDKKVDIKSYPVFNDRIRAKIKCSAKPKLIVIDPWIKLIDVFINDNEKAL